MKFTNAGSVSLDIREVDERDRPDVAALTAADRVVAFGVTDTGIGIAPEKLAVIFEQFQQADGTTSRKFGGTGLGLSISRELAQLLGGLITVTSEPALGSTFTLYLPAELPSDAITGPVARALDVSAVPVYGPVIKTGRDRASVTTARRRLEGITVMIVDDDVRNVFALANTLELHGMQVLYAGNGAEGVRILDDNPHVDIVLMDAMMPEVDGHETTRIIRRNERFAQIPIIFLTAKAMPEDRAAALASGGSDYITKPVDLDELLELMARWVAKRTGSERS
jgi:CheY-like chemotaxis protein